MKSRTEKPRERFKTQENCLNVAGWGSVDGSLRAHLRICVQTQDISCIRYENICMLKEKKKDLLNSELNCFEFREFDLRFA